MPTCKKCGKSYSLLSLYADLSQQLCADCTKDSRKTLTDAIAIANPSALAWTVVRDGITSSPLPRPFPVPQGFGEIPKLTYQEAADCVASQQFVPQFDFLLMCQSYFKPTAGRRGLGCLAALAVYALFAAVVWGGLGIGGLIPAMIGWAIAGGVYLAVARSPKPEGADESLPSLGKFAVVVIAGRKLYLLPLLKSGQRFSCDTLLSFDLDMLQSEVLRNGALSLTLSSGGQPLILERAALKGVPKEATFEVLRQQHEPEKQK